MMIYELMTSLTLIIPFFMLLILGFLYRAIFPSLITGINLFSILLGAISVYLVTYLQGYLFGHFFVVNSIVYPLVFSGMYFSFTLNKSDSTERVSLFLLVLSLTFVIFERSIGGTDTLIFVPLVFLLLTISFFRTFRLSPA